MRATRLITVFFILTLICTLFNACGNTITGNSPTTTANSPESTVSNESDIPIKEYQTIEDLASYADVVSVTKVSYDFSTLDTSSMDEEMNAIVTESITGTVNDILTYEIIYMVDGFKVVGHISAPSDYLTKNYPILVYNRGGNADYSPNTPEWVGRLAYSFQYIIFATQYRETGIGTGKDHFGGEDISDVMFLVNMTQSIAFGDRNKVYMLGSSRGGMETCVAICQDEKSIIKAAVSVSGIYDVANFYSSREENREMLEFRLGGSPSEVPGEYEKRSSVTFADQINIPILIIHSTDDKLTSYADAKKFAQLLDKYDKSYLFITRKGDHHGMEPNEIKSVVEWLESVG